MASNSGINELMEAEKQASEIVKEARAGSYESGCMPPSPFRSNPNPSPRATCTPARVSQMKLAKVEAEKEITRYRTEQDHAFEAANTQADDSEETKRLEASAEAEIADMGQQFQTGKEAVLELMMETATTVALSVPDARKNKRQ